MFIYEIKKNNLHFSEQNKYSALPNRRTDDVLVCINFKQLVGGMVMR